jgi:endonuclease/exonuclease/phosphatase family metal-dependent hydrolase
MPVRHKVPRVDFSGTPVFRLMTVNTLAKPPVEERWKELAAWVAAEGPDVICLQECTQGNGRDVSSWLASSLPGAWSVAFGGVERPGGYLAGNAVLSRWPVEHDGQARLECEDAWPKVLLHVRTSGLDIYCVHLTAALDGAAVREAQVLFVEDFIRATADPASALPPVLAGDFNASPRGSAIAFLRGECSLLGRSAFYQDAWAVAGEGPGMTWDHANPLTPPAFCYDARCDYIFVGAPKVPVGWSSGAREDLAPAGQVTAARLVCNRPLTGHMASDHYGVLAEICWPDRPRT